ncbi:Accessory gene regulator protein AgrB [Dethiosulfatibacter aminovorans DSM 17477]|uniref:Accessory gene regulator protein AgrB n=1 Tax=Dethiosulfatibacter aminovorans DSM 17477 TaxID=1121476 RepID=A0A1M6IJ37_9FIRM|nr:Accessory gene regulator protein AgrB [Dethiosulfatibacter aminovorans DSM 17477]
MEKFVNHIHSSLTKNQNLPEDTLASIYYSLEILINTIVKLLIPMVVFLVIGQIDMYFYILLFTISTRTFIGGVHFSSFIGCTLFTTVFFLLICFLAQTAIVSQTAGICIFVFAILVFALYAPVISRNRPEYDKRQRSRFKMIAITVTVIYLAIFLSTKSWDFAQVILWGVCLSTIQLLIGKEVNRYYERKTVQVQ